MNKCAVIKRHRKRRYRLRRYENELRWLRPVTPATLWALHTRAPDSAIGPREVTCFAIDYWTQNTQVIVAFGYDGICHVVHPEYNGDVERIPHTIDLDKLNALISRRGRRRHQKGNTLAAQLLIRFIVDINNKLDRELGGAYLQFKDAWQVVPPDYNKRPKSAVMKRLKHDLQAIMQTDPDIPTNSSYKVGVYFRSGTMLASYDDLRRHLLSAVNRYHAHQHEGEYKPDPALRTERFIALSWLAFYVLQWEDNEEDRFVCHSMDKSGSGDKNRIGGYCAETQWWNVLCEVPLPSKRNTMLANRRFKKWAKFALTFFKKHALGYELWLLDLATNEEERREVRRRKLLPWAERRWGTSKEELLSALRERSKSDDGRFLQRCEADVAKCRRLLDLFRYHTELRSSRTLASTPSTFR
jgi:hypothetical protein